MVHHRSFRVLSLLFSVLLLATACTGTSDGADRTTTTTSDETSVVTIDSFVTFVDTCRTEMLQPEPDVERLAIDPTLTNLTLGLLADEIPDAAADLHDCLGDADAARYLAADLIVAGQVLPASVGDCLEPMMASDGDALIEVSLRWARLEASDTDVGETFIDAMLECVPGRYLAAPVRTSNPDGYDAAVDESCLDARHEANSEPMELFWSGQVYNRSGTVEIDWTEQQTADVVAALYECIDTGLFIATDPNIGVDLTAATRNCFAEVAAAAGYWESRVAQQPFDTEAYQEATNGCLTAEEALVVLGTPLPVDDPEASNFSAVADCHAEATVGSGEPESLLDDLAGLDDGEADTLVEELAACAGPDGIAGRYAATKYNNRALPEGSYDCLRGTAPADPVEWLRGVLHVESGREVPADAGASYIESMSSCVAPNIFTRPLLRDYSSVSGAIDADCIDAALPAGSEATQAYWTALVFGAADEAGVPTAAATIAVEPIYPCINAGQGFALVAADAGTDLSSDTRDCIDEAITALLPLETTLVGGTLADGAFNGAIADCLTDEEVEDIRGG